MTPFEKALRVLEVQAQFEVAESGARVADAANEREAAERTDQSAVAWREGLAAELRRQLSAERLNTALLDELRDDRMRAAIHAVEARSVLAGSRDDEQRARDELAAHRHRERSLNQMLREEARRRVAGVEERQATEQGDQWVRDRWRAVR